MKRFQQYFGVEVTRLADGLVVGEKGKSRMTRYCEQLEGWWGHMWGEGQIWGGEKRQELRFRRVKFEMPIHKTSSGDLKKGVRCTSQKREGGG